MVRLKIESSFGYADFEDSSNFGIYFRESIFFDFSIGSICEQISSMRLFSIYFSKYTIRSKV